MRSEGNVQIMAILEPERTVGGVPLSGCTVSGLTGRIMGNTGLSVAED